jgi:Fur family peroxide stress response transcriptional regulator
MLARAKPLPQPVVSLTGSRRRGLTDVERKAISSDMDLPVVERVLRERGCALTPQRRAVLRFLDGNLDHPTAGQIFAAVTADFPITSRATVYNTLALLEEIGALRAMRDAEGDVRYDPNSAPHHHLRCEVCGRIEDIPADAVEIRLDGRPATGRVQLDGRCGRCP